MSLKVAVVGCGKIADGHVEEIQKLKNASLVAVCDLEPIMAEQMAIRYGVPAHYSDFDLMLLEQKPDVVHITTPPQSHVPLAQRAVASGCHVYIEKPVALDAMQVRRLINDVERANRKLTVNYWPNFDPPGLALRSLIEEGALGDVVHVESYLGYNLSGAFGQALLSDSNHWVHGLPGKLFQNNLDHVLNKITPLLPDAPAKVHAFAFRRRSSLNGDSTDQMLDELRVFIQAGTVSAYATFCSHARPAGHFLRIYGTRNSVLVDYNLRTLSLDVEQNIPSALGRLIPPFQLARSYFRQARKNTRDFLGSRAHYFAGMNRLISDFYASILEDRPVPIPYSQILLVAELMDEINAQVYSGVLV